jgi:ATP-dependent Clp protease ATP-binding subunit ClpA
MSMHNEELSARHFTTAAIHIIEQLWPRWADRSMPDQMTTEAVAMLALWSLLRWERKVGLVALEKVGVEIEALARDVNRAMDATSAEIRRHAGPPKFRVLPSGRRAVVVDFNTPLQPLLTAAEHEALSLVHSWVGTEHLLLAAVQLGGPRLGEVLERHGVGDTRLQQAVQDVLRS